MFQTSNTSNMIIYFRISTLKAERLIFSLIFLKVIIVLKYFFHYKRQWANQNDTLIITFNTI